MRGTLDLLILRSLIATPLHGLAIARRISQITQQSFDVKPGSLFPALYDSRNAASSRRNGVNPIPVAARSSTD